MTPNYRLADYWRMKAQSTSDLQEQAHAAIVAHATRRFPPLSALLDRRPVPVLEFSIDAELRRAARERKAAQRLKEEQEARRQRELDQLAEEYGGF